MAVEAKHPLGVAHKLFHAVLPYSNWEWAVRAHSESVLSLRGGLNATFGRLGRVPRQLLTDHSSTATHRLAADGSRRGFNEEYLGICAHFGLEPRTINVGCPHESGACESAHGQPKAIDGTLAVMVGGRQEVLDRCVAVFKAMAASVARVGDIVAGNVAKLANQVVVALNIAAVSEALVLAAKAGVEPELVYQAIRGGLAGSTVMDAKAPLMFDRKISPGFRINLHIKDLDNAVETFYEVGAPLPFTASVMKIMQALKADDLGDCDHGAMIRYFEKQAKVQLKRSSAG